MASTQNRPSGLAFVYLFILDNRIGWQGSADRRRTQTSAQHLASHQARQVASYSPSRRCTASVLASVIRTNYMNLMEVIRRLARRRWQADAKEPRWSLTGRPIRMSCERGRARSSLTSSRLAGRRGIGTSRRPKGWPSRCGFVSGSQQRPVDTALASRLRRARCLAVGADHHRRGALGRRRAARPAVREYQLDRPGHHRRRNRRAKAAIAAGDRGRHGALVPGLLRARGRIRPGVHADNRGQGRRLRRNQRPENLDLLRTRGAVLLPARPDQH
jgi:hypothetical protein